MIIGKVQRKSFFSFLGWHHYPHSLNYEKNLEIIINISDTGRETLKRARGTL
jgi:hypothetical protein